MALRCDHGPDELRRIVACLAGVSKDVQGELIPLDAEKEECRKLDCRSLTTIHALKAEVSAHDCDSELAKALDGRLVIERLTTIFEDADPTGRGIHAGVFAWRGQQLYVEGRIQGVTNAGITRAPLRTACEECRNPGVMIGRLCGRVVRSALGPELVGTLVTGIYRFEYDPTEEGGSGRVTGVVEGALVRECTTEPRCVDFTALADGPNPRIEQGHTIEVFDHQGNPQPATEVPTWGAITGLHLWFRTTVALAGPADLVRATIAHFSSGATVTAFDGGGTQVAQATVVGPQGVPIEVTLAAPGIARLEIDCPNDENLLVKLCVEDGTGGTSGDEPHSA